MKNIIKRVFLANLELPKRGLVTYTWGNVSGIDRKKGRVVIKPSGVEYESMKMEDMVVTDMEGTVIQGDLRPSSDLATHLALYRAFPGCGGIVHTHSRMSTAWAQARRDLPLLGTTHGDYFYGPVPCTREMTEAEIKGNYERETGNVIIETFTSRGIEPATVPAVLVANHGPFCWGTSPEEAVHNAVVLEEIAYMACFTDLLSGGTPLPMPQRLLDKHYLRKHGENSYYGQG